MTKFIISAVVRQKPTSILRTFHVKFFPVWRKIFWSCLLCTIVQFTDILTNDKVVALTPDFFFAPQIALLRESNPYCFKGVTSEEHSSYGVFIFMTLARGVNDINPEHHECQPELWTHSALNAVLS